MAPATRTSLSVPMAGRDNEGGGRWDWERDWKGNMAVLIMAALSGLRYKPAAFDRGSFHAVEGTAEPWRKHQTGAGLDQITS